MTTALKNAVSTEDELLSYETLWSIRDQSLKTLAEWFTRHPGPPSALLEILNQQDMLGELGQLHERVESALGSVAQQFSVCLHGSFQYPRGLRDADHPLEMFYYRGDLGLLESPCVSVVGARRCTAEGVARAKKMGRALAEAGFTVISGLAEGIDTAAMTAAIEAGGKTVGVIGTPITEVYPKKNADLQEKVARDHLLISQVPIYRYSQEPFKTKRRYFPQRNITMAALSKATIIIEASDTSGTLTQARAALRQGRKLFILRSCVENKTVKWPAEYLSKGAVCVREFADVVDALGAADG